MDLDSFFVSVERMLNPLLNGRPVLVGGSSSRGVVASCSYEARKFGIHSAMPMKRARQLCPHAIVVKGNYEAYSDFSGQVTDIIHNAVPLYEKTSIDEFYIDLTGMDRYFGCYKIATELREKIIRETGLPISFALSSNKTVSKIGTGQAKPNGQIQIEHGKEKQFLAPLSVKEIPMVGEKTYQLLSSIGIEKIKDLQEMPVERVQHVLGENGLVLWNKANGIDHSPVEPYGERKSLSTEQTFGEDTLDVPQLKRILLSMAEKLAYQLRDEEKLTSCVTVKIRYADFTTQTMQMRVPYTALDGSLIEKAKLLFDKLHQPHLAVRLIGVRFSHLIQGTYQYDLFSNVNEQMQLYQAMDKLRHRFGSDAVVRAAGMNMEKGDVNMFKAISDSKIKPENKGR